MLQLNESVCANEHSSSATSLFAEKDSLLNYNTDCMKLYSCMKAGFAECLCHKCNYLWRISEFPFQIFEVLAVWM